MTTLTEQQEQFAVEIVGFAKRNNMPLDTKEDIDALMFAWFEAGREIYKQMADDINHTSFIVKGLIK